MEEYQTFIDTYLRPACEDIVSKYPDFDPYLASALYGVLGMAYNKQDMDRIFDYLKEQAISQEVRRLN